MPIQLCPVANSPSRTPISSPIHAPVTAPAPAARALVSRPVTRSTSRRSEPTISSCSTGNPSSESRSDRVLGGLVVIEPRYGIPGGAGRDHREPVVHHRDVLSSARLRRRLPLTRSGSAPDMQKGRVMPCRFDEDRSAFPGRPRPGRLPGRGPGRDRPRDLTRALDSHDHLLTFAPWRHYRRGACPPVTWPRGHARAGPDGGRDHRGEQRRQAGRNDPGGGLLLRPGHSRRVQARRNPAGPGAGPGRAGIRIQEYLRLRPRPPGCRSLVPSGRYARSRRSAYQVG